MLKQAEQGHSGIQILLWRQKHVLLDCFFFQIALSPSLSCFVGFISSFASYDPIVCVLKIVSEHCLLFKQVERAFSVCGTIEYMAPEIVEGGESGHDKVFMCWAVCFCSPLRLSLWSPEV